MKTRLTFIIIFLVSLLFVGCSSGSSGPSPSEQSNWDEMKWDQGKWG